MVAISRSKEECLGNDAEKKVVPKLGLGLQIFSLIFCLFHTQNYVYVN